MKKSTTTMMMLLLSISLCFSQDIITKKSGEDIQSKIMEVTQTEVKYKIFDNQEGPLFTLLKSDVLMIRYKNGSKDVFNDSKSSTSSASEMVMKGQEDAAINYKGAKSGAGWTAAAAILTSPVLALIPAAICSSSAPEDVNLNYKNPELMKNAEYNKAYSDKAHSIKKRKVWTNYGIGSGAWLVLLLLL
jgi:hypothetical protein